MPIYAVLILVVIALGTLAIIAMGIWWQFGNFGLLILGLVLAYVLGTALLEGVIAAPFEYLLNRSGKAKPKSEETAVGEEDSPVR